MAERMPTVAGVMLLLDGTVLVVEIEMVGVLTRLCSEMDVMCKLFLPSASKCDLFEI